MTGLCQSWEWQPVPEPPAPGAALGWGAAARRLCARLAALPPEWQARLQVTANRDVLVVIGEAADLPWVDGIEYAYKSAEAPALWLPTQWRPDVSPDLLFRALQLAHQRQPLLLWHAPAAVVPLDRQLPLGPGVLEMIAARWEGR